MCAWLLNNDFQQYTCPAPTGGRTNVAVTVVAAVTVRVHVPAPLHPPPLQPVKVEPVAGVAVRVTTAPLA